MKHISYAVSSIVLNIIDNPAYLKSDKKKMAIESYCRNIISADDVNVIF